MSDRPFGFPTGDSSGDDPERREGPESGGSGEPTGPLNPAGGGTPSGGTPGGGPFPFGFGGMFPAGAAPGGGFGGPIDFSALGPMLEQLQRMMSGSGGPVNWELAKHTAVSAARPAEASTQTTQEQVEQAMHIADLWLTDRTTFPSGVRRTETWRRTEWIERTLDVWAQLCNPVAAKMVEAMSGLMPTEGMTAIPGMPPLPGLEGILGQMGGMMFGGQVGQALAQLSAEVLSATDVGIPLGPDGTAVLLPQNVDEFTAGLEIDPEQVRLYLALREAAYQRLFSHVPWLKGRLLGAVEAYAAGITIDGDAIERAVSEINPEDLQSNPEKIQEIMSSGVFEPQQTPAQQVALGSLETLLALIEGWVDRVVTQTAEGRLPEAPRLGETMRRRRAVGGPAEQTFATLVGLELRPRRLRDAATLWETIEQHRGVEGRDALWEHPDLLPTSSDLDDPIAFATAGALTDTAFTEEDFDALLRGDAPPSDDEGDGEDGEGPVPTG